VKPFRWGILGTGYVARKFALGLRAAREMGVGAVASRSGGNARAFASALKVPAAFASYEAAVREADVDAFYIATPPTTHRDLALMCIRAGKPVLVEKPFAENADAAGEIIEAARAIVPRDVPFVADSNNAHTLADIRRDEARWRALGLLFFEDPFWPPEDLLAMDRMAGVPIGMGADFGSTEQMAVYVKAPAIAVLQPDVCMLGGLTEASRAVRMVEAAGKTPAPHTPFAGPAALASLHLLASAKDENCFAAIEPGEGRDMYGIGLPRWQPTIDVPSGPGLGFDPDPAFLRAHDCAK